MCSIFLKCSKYCINKSYMLNLRSVNHLLLNLSFLTMLCPVREFKLMNLKLTLSTVGLLLPLSRKCEASMGGLFLLPVYQRF